MLGAQDCEVAQVHEEGRGRSGYNWDEACLSQVAPALLPHATSFKTESFQSARRWVFCVRSPFISSVLAFQLAGSSALTSGIVGSNLLKELKI